MRHSYHVQSNGQFAIENDYASSLAKTSSQELHQPTKRPKTNISHSESQVHERTVLGDITASIQNAQAEITFIKPPSHNTSQVEEVATNPENLFEALYLSSTLKSDLANPRELASISVLPCPSFEVEPYPEKTTDGSSGQPVHIEPVPAAQAWVDIDALNAEDPQACSSLATTIFDYLLQVEMELREDHTYLTTVQTEVTAHMRSVLTDWLIEVCEEFKCCADTLYLTINMIDRYLSKRCIARSKLQLLGVAATWAAAKFEEIFSPEVSKFVFIADFTYTQQDIVDMEADILVALDWRLNVPTAKTFLRRALQVCEPDEMLHYLSNYLTEVTLMEYSMLQFPSSVRAAAALFLSNVLLGRPAWSPTLEHYIGLKASELKEAVHALAVAHFNLYHDPSFRALRDKYECERYKRVSRIAPVGELSNELFV